MCRPIAMASPAPRRCSAPRVSPRLIPVSGEESGVRVTGYLAAPELAQATARGVQLFVGRRPVRDRGLLHALAMGYGELVPRGRYPIAVILVDMPAGAVDVNVHPQKLEVRFSDAAAVAAAVRHIVQAGVNAARWRDEAGGAGPVPLQPIASVAPPVLPFDGRAATQLAERHVAQMRSRQVPLGFGAAAEAVASSERGGSERSAIGRRIGRRIYRRIWRCQPRVGEAVARSDAGVARRGAAGRVGQWRGFGASARRTRRRRGRRAIRASPPLGAGGSSRPFGKGCCRSGFAVPGERG